MSITLLYMDTLICDYCGSKNLLWDYVRGEIVCGDCGTTLDKVYDYRPVYAEEVSRTSGQGYILKNNRLDSYREFIELMKKTRFMRKFKGVKLNLSGNDRRIHISRIYSPISLDALYKLQSDRVAFRIYKYLEDKGIFSGLKFKTRVLLTYYLIYGNNRARIKNLFKQYYTDEENIKRVAKQIPFTIKLEIMRILDQSEIKV